MLDSHQTETPCKNPFHNEPGIRIRLLAGYWSSAGKLIFPLYPVCRGKDQALDSAPPLASLYLVYSLAPAVFALGWYVLCSRNQILRSTPFSAGQNGHPQRWNVIDDPIGRGRASSFRNGHAFIRLYTLGWRDEGLIEVPKICQPRYSEALSSHSSQEQLMPSHLNEPRSIHLMPLNSIHILLTLVMGTHLASFHNPFNVRVHGLARLGIELTSSHLVEPPDQSTIHLD